MGQGASRTERPAERSDSSSFLRRSAPRAPSQSGQRDGSPAVISAAQPVGSPRSRTSRARPRSLYRLSQFLHNDSTPDDANENQQNENGQGEEQRSEGSRTGQMVQRTRSTLRNMLGRNDTVREPRHPRIGPPLRPRPTRAASPRPSSSHEAVEEPVAPARYISPHNLDTHFDEALAEAAWGHVNPGARSSSSPATHRPGLRLGSLRPERSSLSRRLASFRRRRSTQPDIRRLDGADDQALMLSRLLSVAAAATAATLMGHDSNALDEARSLTSSAGVGEDGSFDGFLRSLQSGRIASALRAGADGEGNPSPAPLNFFRMFRFATANAPAVAPSAPAAGSENGDGNTDQRLVPIIIVGIRAISPNADDSPDNSDPDLNPLISPLGSVPSPLNPLDADGHDSIDSILRPPENGTSFRHRRRASMGAFNLNRARLNDRMDDQRDHRSPDRRRERPWSMASSSSAFEPRPPPATPASPSPADLSRISSRQTTPNTSRRASFIANSMRDLTDDSRRSSMLHRSTPASPLSAHTEEPASLHTPSHSSTNLFTPSSSSGPSHQPASSDLNERPTLTGHHRRSETNPNVHYPRFASGHPRRNGVVEPDHLRPQLSSRSSRASNHTTGSDGQHQRRGSDSTTTTTDNSRSWIIYVLGGSYPEDHPLLTTPSLFTENPTYEDMMLLSALLGPAKAPVASEEDVESAGGLYVLQIADGEDVVAAAGGSSKSAQLVAVPAREEKTEQQQQHEEAGGDGNASTEENAGSSASDAGALEQVYLEMGAQCRVCLCDFEVAETVRRLVSCQHLFHRECIDQWLTQGRNSCPLCRGQGVTESEAKTTSSSSPSAERDDPVISGATAASGRARRRHSAVAEEDDYWPGVHV